MRVAFSPSSFGLLVLFAVAGSLDSMAAETMPLTMHVRDAGAPIRCSASNEHEPVVMLKAGDTVEVWRREPGGWLAIRPPAGSISWVAASKVKTTADSTVVEIAADDAVSWIGAGRSNRRICWHVQLKPGEKVKVLGARTLPGDGLQPDQTWFKIEPPAGEFRWVHQRWVSEQPPAAVAKPTESIHAVKPAGWEARSDKNAPAKPDANAQASATETASPVAQPVVPPTPNTARSEEQFRTALTQTQIQLAALVAQPPQSWQLDKMKADVKQMVIDGPTPLLRGEAQLLLERVNEFQQLLQGYQQMAAAPTGNPHQPAPVPAIPLTPATPAAFRTYQPVNVYPQPQLAANPYTPAPVGPLRSAAQRIGQAIANGPSGGGLGQQYAIQPAVQPQVAMAAANVSIPSPPANTSGARYDGVGWLMPLVARSQLNLEGRSSVPPFALTDDKGNVLQLVTPSPGVNLRRYVRQKVAVVGQAGQLPGVLTPHLTAQRVVVLEETR